MPAGNRKFAVDRAPVLDVPVRLFAPLINDDNRGADFASRLTPDGHQLVLPGPSKVKIS